MNIQTEFNIGNIVLEKFNSFNPTKSGIIKYKGLCIVYITSETCSAGTQIFYHCRILLALREGKFPAEPDNIISVEFGRADGDNRSTLMETMVKIREDELKKCPKDIEKEFRKFE